MHTTLHLLKRTDACVGGFGRQLAFFGTSLKIKDQVIPLHVVSLIGGVEDTKWAARNALEINQEEFQELFQRTVPNVWNFFMQRHVVSAVESMKNSPSNKKYKENPGYEMYPKALAAKTTGDILNFIELCRYKSYDLTLWSEAIENQIWTSPAAYILKLIEVANSTYRGIKKGKSTAVRMDVYYFDYCSKTKSKGENLARVLKPVGTYDFIHSMNIRDNSGIAKVGNDVVITLSDSQKAFNVIRMMNSKQTTDQEDQDENDDVEYVTPPEVRTWDATGTPRPATRAATPRSPRRPAVATQRENDDDDSEDDSWN